MKRLLSQPSPGQHSRCRRAVAWSRLWCCAFLLSFTACINVKYVSIEQMVPAPYPLVEGLSVGVLDNCSPYNIALMYDDIHAYSCEGDSLMEYVAQYLADSEVFSEVVVLDSCIYPANDTVFHLLTVPEVERLCEYLDVDMLYVCDYGCVTSWGPEAVDGECRTYLASHVYVPGHTEPTHSFILDDFLRRGTYRNRAEVDKWIHRSYDRLGTLAVECFTSHWETHERAFYDGPSFNLREATVYVRDGRWDDAFQLWQDEAQKKNKRHRLVSLFNQALYHEMNDSLDLALRCLAEADTYVTDTTAVDSTLLQEWFNTDLTIGEFPYTDHQRIVSYQNTLRERKEDIRKIIIAEQKKRNPQPIAS